MLKKLLAALGAVLKNYAEQEKVIKAMAGFCGVSISEIKIWLTGKKQPRGLPLIKIREVFVCSGFKVPEYDKLTEPLKYLFLLLAYNCFDSRKLYLELDYKHHDEFLRPLTIGDNMPGPKRIDRISEFCQKNWDVISSVKRFDVLKPISHLINIFLVGSDGLVTNQTANIRGLVTATNELLAIILPAVNDLLDASVEDRQVFRDKINSSDQNLLFDFSNNLYNCSESVNKICTETAMKKLK